MTCSLCGEVHAVILTVRYETVSHHRFHGNRRVQIEHPGGEIRLCFECWRGNYPRS